MNCDFTVNYHIVLMNPRNYQHAFPTRGRMRAALRVPVAVSWKNSILQFCQHEARAGSVSLMLMFLCCWNWDRGDEEV